MCLDSYLHSKNLVYMHLCTHLVLNYSEVVPDSTTLDGQQLTIACCLNEGSASASKATCRLDEKEADPDTCSLQFAHIESNLSGLSLQVASHSSASIISLTFPIPRELFPVNRYWTPGSTEVVREHTFAAGERHMGNWQEKAL